MDKRRATNVGCNYYLAGRWKLELSWIDNVCVSLVENAEALFFHETEVDQTIFSFTQYYMNLFSGTVHKKLWVRWLEEAKWTFRILSRVYDNQRLLADIQLFRLGIA